MKKTFEEIKELAEDYLDISIPTNGYNGYVDAYIKGYTKCQQDNEELESRQG